MGEIMSEEALKASYLSLEDKATGTDIENQEAVKFINQSRIDNGVKLQNSFITGNHQSDIHAAAGKKSNSRSVS